MLKTEIPGDHAAASPRGEGYEVVGTQWKMNYGGTLSSLH